MNERKIYALGFFDGVHLGHQALLKACCQLADAQGAVPAAITFLRHPQALFRKNPPPLLSGEADRDRLLGQYGIRHICKLPVTDKVMSTPWEEFLDYLLADGAVGFVCGDDFRFGSRGEGNAQKLQTYCASRNLPCVTVAEQLMDGVRISSTHIRRLLEAGQVSRANVFLGHPHTITGQVVRGRQLGRTIGIPTANLELPDEILCPRHGVYACRVLLENRQLMAVTNVGTRPTVSGHHITVEPWILDFDGDLYGKTLTLEFYDFLRPEEKFDSLEALQTQIRQDAEKTRQLLG